MPRLCVSSEGAVDSIQLVTRMPLGRVRSVADAESATSVVLTRVLIRRPSCSRSRRPRGRREAPDRHAASRARSRTRRRTTTSAACGSSEPAADGVRRVGRAEPLVDGLLELQDALVASVRLARSERAARLRGERALRLSTRVPRPLLREAPLQLRPTSGQASTRSSRWPATSASSRTCPSLPSRPSRTASPARTTRSR